MSSPARPFFANVSWHGYQLLHHAPLAMSLLLHAKYQMVNPVWLQRRLMLTLSDFFHTDSAEPTLERFEPMSQEKVMT